MVHHPYRDQFEGSNQRTEVVSGRMGSRACQAPFMWRSASTSPVVRDGGGYRRHITGTATQELKIGDFKPADSGQVELYLRWLDRHERQPGEEPPVAIILCAGKKREAVEYLDLGKSGIHVAEYLTELPPREVLRERFHKALSSARARLEQRAPGDGVF